MPAAGRLIKLISQDGAFSAVVALVIFRRRERRGRDWKFFGARNRLLHRRGVRLVDYCVGATLPCVTVSKQDSSAPSLVG
jgi:hypothetical protein